MHRNWRFDSLEMELSKINLEELPLVVQWLRLCAPDAGNPDSTPGQGTITRSHMLQLRSSTDKLKIPKKTTKTQRLILNVIERVHICKFQFPYLQTTALLIKSFTPTVFFGISSVPNHSCKLPESSDLFVINSRLYGF